MGPSTEDELKGLRNVMSPMIKGIQELLMRRPMSGAEITLGLRALQLARMWLGAAEAMERGKDPWENQVEEK